MAAAPQRHESYNNRFRRSSTLSSTGASVSENICSVSSGMDIFGQPPFGSLRLQLHSQGDGLPRQTSCDQPQSPTTPQPLDACGAAPPKPLAPGKPRRLSRQASADTKRQAFAGARQGSGSTGGHCNAMSAESVDDVFFEMGGSGSGAHHYNLLHEPALFPGKRKPEPILSTSSTASILPNPYNRINHRIHSMIWCCGCLYFVFFCCLPAIHFMEHSDIEYNQGDHKRARTLGRMSTFLFFTGSLVMLCIFALVFFLAIFFTVYN